LKTCGANIRKEKEACRGEKKRKNRERSVPRYPHQYCPTSKKKGGEGKPDAKPEEKRRGRGGRGQI